MLDWRLSQLPSSCSGVAIATSFALSQSIHVYVARSTFPLSAMILQFIIAYRIGLIGTMMFIILFQFILIVERMP